MPPQKMPVMPAFAMLDPSFSSRLAQRVEQLRRGEHALDVVPGGEDRHRLIDAVLLVRLQVLHPALLDELDDPARVEVDAEADAAAVLAQVLDRQPQPARAGRPEHQPVAALGEELVRAACRRTSRSRCGSRRRRCGSWGCRWCRRSRRRTTACPCSPFGIQRRHRAAAEPFVLEERELLDVVEALHVLERVEVEASWPSPARTACRCPG